MTRWMGPSGAARVDRGEEGNPDAVAAVNVHAALLANTKTAGTGRGSWTRLRYELKRTAGVIFRKI